MKTKSIVLIVVSLGFGCIAAVGMVQVMARNNSAGPDAKTRPVLVALTDLEINDELTEENVKVEQWPESMVPEGVVTSWEDAEACRIATRVIKGYPIQAAMLLQPGQYSGLNIRRGYRVFSMSVSKDETFHGLLKPGDHVDVVGVFKKNDETKEEVAQTLLTNIRVFAVNAQTNRLPNSEGEPQDIRVVQLEVTQEQAEELALVERRGSIRLLMRGHEEPEDDTSGSMPTELAEIEARLPDTAPQANQIVDAAKMLMGMFSAMGSPTDQVATIDVNRPHVMTMISPDGMFQYEWTSRDEPPFMKDVTHGQGGGYSGFPAPSFGSSQSADSTQTAGGGSVGNAGSDAGSGSDGSDESDLSFEEDDVDW